MLAQAGVTTNISVDEVARLDAKWSWFKATVAEEDTGYTDAGGDSTSFHGLCPEVAYERFGAFATYLGKAGDEFDTDARHSRLSREQAPPDHPEWRWSGYVERHYSECREFSIFVDLAGPLAATPSKSRKASTRKTMGLKLRWQVLARDAYTCVYCGKRPPDVALEVDHKLAVANGGTNEMDNLVSSCQGCNRGKGALPLVN